MKYEEYKDSGMDWRDAKSLGGNAHKKNWFI